MAQLWRENARFNERLWEKQLILTGGRGFRDRSSEEVTFKLQPDARRWRGKLFKAGEIKDTTMAQATNLGTLRLLLQRISTKASECVGSNIRNSNKQKTTYTCQKWGGRGSELEWTMLKKFIIASTLQYY